MQLLAAGFTRHQIQGWLDLGILVPVHHGVYFAIHATSPLANECAAILACGPQAMLSFRVAAPLWALPARKTDLIDITVVGRRPSAKRGVRIHYMNHLAPGDLRRREGLPISSPALTILDLAGLDDEEEFRKVLNEARIQRLVTDRELRATIDRHPLRAGARLLSARLDSERGPQVTRSEAERLALRVMHAHGIEPDESDYSLGRYRVDFLFRREMLAVEVDGYQFHGGRDRFISDRRRIAALGAMGFQVHPLTWFDLTERSAAAMVDLAETLDRRRRLLG